MNQQIEDLKAQLDTQSATLDTIGTNVVGVRGDVTNLKQQIQDLINNGNGATQQDLIDLKAKVDIVGGKIDTLNADTAALDQETT